MRILIVEDDHRVAEQAKRTLEAANFVVDLAHDGEEGHFLGDTESYDAVVLDLGLPMLDGLSVLQRWRQDGRTMPVLILTARGTWREKVMGLRAGADDYLAKPFEMEEMLARVEALIRRAAGHSSPVLGCGPLRLDTTTHRLTMSGAPVELTALEFRLISYLLHHQGSAPERACRHGDAAMVAAFGFLAPVAGALLQEGIDVAVILNALRALGSGGSRRATLPKMTSERMRLEHRELQNLLDRIRTAAERPDQQGSEGVRSELRELDRLLQEQLLPHERREEADVYPQVANLLGGPLAALSRTHREIVHLVNVYRRLIADLPAQGADPAVWSDLRRVLFSLEAILRLHIDQEDEVYDIVGQPG